ncbi:hypothetical protein DS544_06955 [Salmonella enterica subsp. enterica serovar Abony]|nr:hypothetical protein [Salmonella enterica subsp. enterica serovar Abony]
MKSGVTVRSDNSQAILDALKTIGKKEVLIGIPEDASSREDAHFGNAGIGYLNEFGSPAQNIPPRPHLQPGIRSADDQTIPLLKEAAQAALDGNTTGAERALGQAGQKAVNGVKIYMHKANFTPLADSTIEARAKRGKKGRKGARAELARRDANGKLNATNAESGQLISNENARPLIDTGKYSDSIKYIVRDKDEKYF